MDPALRTDLARVTWDLTRAVLPEFVSDPRYPWFGLAFDDLDASLRRELETEAEKHGDGTAAEIVGLTAYLGSIATDPTRLPPVMRNHLRRLMLGAFARIDQMQATLAGGA